MKVEINNIYKNSDGDYFTPAQSGDYFIVDMWQCDKNGMVEDIEENPYPAPVQTSNLVFYSESSRNYEYPEFSINF